MIARTTSRPVAARLAAALLALPLLLTACAEDAPAPEPAPTVSDAGGAESAGGDDGANAPSDGDGATAAPVPQDPYPVTPAPEGFTPPDPCSGEGAYYVRVGETASPELPERAGETLTVEAVGIEDDHAQLEATLGDGTSLPIEDITLGETVTVDLWTLSVTSVCADTGQIEFDLID